MQWNGGEWKVKASRKIFENGAEGIVHTAGKITPCTSLERNGAFSFLFCRRGVEIDLGALALLHNQTLVRKGERKMRARAIRRPRRSTARR